MKPAGTLLLGRRDVTALLGIDECIAAVELAFTLHAQGKTMPPGVLGVPSRDGGFHIKAAGLELQRRYFAVKVNGNFFQNTTRYGMPNIQGVIVLCDGDNGYPLALLDSIEITILRTGAATAVAAKHLALDDAAVATICGCGNQGRVQLRAIARVRPIQRVFAYDSDGARAERFAEEMAEEMLVEVMPVRDLSAAVRQSQICVTCTPSSRAFLGPADVAPGAFIAAVGADNPEKQEIEPALLASATLVVDILEQAATIGDLHHAIAAGVLTRESVHAELGDVVAGTKAGRTSAEEIIVFDSTGTALQDVAAAALVYEKALSVGRGAVWHVAE
jgi:ornithine cyclodeaminase/alanine dehydrogenase-like protein (mu-crystallin family)